MKKVKMSTGLQAVASAGTAEALVSSATIVRKVILSAEAGNTGIIVVGDSNALATVGAARGIEMAAGELVTLEFPANEAGLRGSDAAPGIDLNELYVDALNAGDSVSWVAFVW